MKWIKSFFEEDHGKGSIKRVISVILIALFCYGVVHVIRNGINEATTTFCEVVGGLIFGFVAVLLGLTYIPTRSKDEKQPKINDQ